MQALVYEGAWQMPLREIENPAPEPGEVVVAVKAVGICGSDVHGYTGSTGRRYPGIALFSLVALLVAFTSGSPQGWVRFVVVAPALYIFLSRLGRNVAFDRAWTLGSVLVMSLLTLLYTYDMWVA